MEPDPETRPLDDSVARGVAAPPKLRDLEGRSETIDAVRAGLASADRGEGRPLDDAFDALEEEFRPRARA